MGDEYAAVDALAEAYFERGGQPGLAYGIVAGGSLVHAGGLGGRWVGGPAPDAGTVFRIASMTKSFTATAMLLLREDGALDLGDPAGKYLPQLRDLRLPASDSPVITIAHLLTMTAGFPTDDPWGDRQQGLPLADFDRFLAGGVGFAWVPGTRFEYANLGYAILGRIITAVSGQAYQDFMAERVLAPLGLDRTGFEASGFDPAGLARGHRHGPDGWIELVPDPCGAFAPMGGIFTCVTDLARWVSGFAAAFPPGAADTGHPLPAAARREMQLPQVAITPTPWRLPGGVGGGPVSYGLGLFVEDDPAWGRMVHHSGGYPGFGSHMRWHPATGTGVIVLANATYQASVPLAARMLDTVLRAAPAPGGPALAPAGPWPETRRAQEDVMALLRSWDDAAAARLFTGNVAQDEPYAERLGKIERIRDRIGGIGHDPGRPAEFDSPAHCRWWLRGDRGAVQAEIKLTGERPPRVQLLTLAVPPAAGSPLAGVLDTLLSCLNDGAPGWPSALPVSAWVDTTELLRQLRMAHAWAGECRLGAFRAGNGETSATAELDGTQGRLTLAVVIDQAGHLHQADLLPVACARPGGVASERPGSVSSS